MLHRFIFLKSTCCIKMPVISVKLREKTREISFYTHKQKQTRKTIKICFHQRFYLN